MSELELHLKEYLGRRPEARSHILTVEELAEYTSWMATDYGRSIDEGGQRCLIEGINADTTGPMMTLGRKILSDPSDLSALSQLSAHWGMQREGSYIHANQDISAWQMIRYMPAHWHQNDFFTIFYAFSGECPVHFTNEVVTVRPGTVLIVAPNVTHAHPCYGDDQVLVYYNMRSSTFDQVFWSQIPSDNLMSGFFRQALGGRQPNSYLHFETEKDEEIRDLMLGIFDEYQQQAAYSEKLMNSLMTTCLILLMRSYEGTVRLPRSETFRWKHDYSAILSHIQANFATTSLAELSSLFHYSEKQIRRIVLEYTGMRFSELTTKLRMERAATLLGMRELSISETASLVGYSTTSSFYRSFTRYFGCTPGELRDAALDESRRPQRTDFPSVVQGTSSAIG